MIVYDLINNLNMSDIKFYKFTHDQVDTVVFHFPCMDGLSSAWVAYYYYKLKHPEKKLNLVPAQHGKPMLYDMTNHNVLFVDFCPQLTDLETLKANSNNVYILDHHIGAKERLENCSFATFDMLKSGVGLAWDYFFPDLPIPEFLDMIQQRDIWTPKFESSPRIQAFCQGIFQIMDLYETFDDKFAKFDKMINSPDVEIDTIVQFGTIINQTKQNQIKAIVNKIKNNKYKFTDTRTDEKTGQTSSNTYIICMYNCSYDLASDLGNALSREHCDLAILWSYDHLTETYHYSLRSTNKVNCNDIAKRYLDGGGHPNASGGKNKKHPDEIFGQTKTVDL